jgi:ABC-type Fe3+-siderophore transport system permease subunit
MIEPAPLLIALSVGVALLIGRLLSARASLPVGLFGAVVGAPLVGAILGERLTARIATDWERGQRP